MTRIDNRIAARQATASSASMASTDRGTNGMTPSCSATETATARSALAANSARMTMTRSWMLA